jgi:azurin
MKNIIYILLIALVTFSCNNKPATKKVETNKKENVVEKPNEIAIILNSNDQMQFDKKVLSASPGQSITLTLNHTGRGNKMIMGHNFVLLKKDVDVDVFARKAVEARDSEYIPEGDEMIAYTGLIGGGESITITFDAPEQGVYNFICSFPAHYQLMRGQLIVK